ncbi:uncharacterized protein LOC113157684 [Anabas testudineus]|uniref:uncharacterized protein LOC113157684 n=1 Tax=Anabas testudineus TaxID=64144 RepID=UPI000E455455|nr:uncharacterized protein LOC113157684 [Anabas testudineus]
MIWLLLMLSFITSVWMFVSPSFFQTEENNDVTLTWVSQTKTDMSLANLVCFFQCEPPKVLYEMINGVEVPQSQHQQFTGRVQVDKEALRDGRMRLRLSRVTAEDSGNYWCDLAVNYDRNTRTWELETSEKFVVNENQTSDGDNSDESLSTATSGPGTKGSEITLSIQHKEFIFLAVFIGSLAAMVVLAFGKLICQHPPQKDQESQSLIVRKSKEVEVNIPECSSGEQTRQGLRDGETTLPSSLLTV